jgi:hypothetical protein
LPAALTASCDGSRSEFFRSKILRVYHAAEGNRGLRLVRISTWRSKVQSGQPCSVQQHDLPLGLAEEPEDALAVKM